MAVVYWNMKHLLYMQLNTTLLMLIKFFKD